VAASVYGWARQPDAPRIVAVTVPKGDDHQTLAWIVAQWSRHGSAGQVAGRLIRPAEGGYRTVFGHGRGDGLQDGQPNIVLSARSAVASRSFSSRRKMSYSAM
jgi:hypothetical protein